MTDDLSTVSVRRGDRTREIELLKQHYREHREALRGLLNDAPSESLAREYHRLIADIDTALTKLEELEVGNTTRVSEPPPPPPPPSAYTSPSYAPAAPMAAAAAAAAGATVNDRMRTAGDRPLAPSSTVSSLPPLEPEPRDEPASSGASGNERPSGSPNLRALMMVAGALIVLAIIGWLIWRASSDRKPASAIVETPASTTGRETAVDSSRETVTVPVTPAPVAAATLRITPATSDYGTIRKGTRAVRQFELTNGSSAPLAIHLSRSNCRCLFYDYHETVPANAKETITVTIDAARVKNGSVDETVTVAGKKDPSATATFAVRARIE
jgi:hypothetical protein